MTYRVRVFDGQQWTKWGDLPTRAEATLEIAQARQQCPDHYKFDIEPVNYAAA